MTAAYQGYYLHVLKPGLSWSAVLIALLVCHIGGDFLFQTEWQAMTKGRGLGDRDGRRALFLHVSTYTAAYLPALVWIALDVDLLHAVITGVAVLVPHLLIDDGRVVDVWMRRVKHVGEPIPWLRIAVDQAMHVVCLLGAALLAVT